MPRHSPRDIISHFPPFFSTAYWTLYYYVAMIPTCAIVIFVCEHVITISEPIYLFMETAPKLQAQRPRHWEVVWHNGFVIIHILLLLAVLALVATLGSEDTLVKWSLLLQACCCVLQLVDCYRSRRKHYAVLTKSTDVTLEDEGKGAISDVQESAREKQM